MALNNLLASPGFAAWTRGRTARHAAACCYTPGGKPRVAIFSIAHLGDAERMFFVTLLLNQVLGWMRTQSGTTSLRALLYMDEIFGYFPPVGQSALQAAAAHAAQAGARLRRGRACSPRRTRWTSTTRVWPISAPGSSAGCRPSATSRACSTGWRARRLRPRRFSSIAPDGQTLAGLGNRVFLMNNVHEERPWCLRPAGRCRTCAGADARSNQDADGSD